MMNNNALDSQMAIKLMALETALAQAGVPAGSSEISAQSS